MKMMLRLLSAPVAAVLIAFGFCVFVIGYLLGMLLVPILGGIACGMEFDKLVKRFMDWVK